MTPLASTETLRNASRVGELASHSTEKAGNDQISFDARVLAVLASFNYCLLRDGDDSQTLSESSEWDLLVAPHQRTALVQELRRMGFLPMPSLGYAPHTFLLAYDESNDRWLKLDLVDRIHFGSRYSLFATDLAEHVLETRIQVEGRWIPCADAEFVCMLLHTLLDKPAISDERQRRLLTLALQRDTRQAWDARLKGALPDSVSLDELIEDVRCQRWASLEARRPQIRKAFLAREKTRVSLRRLQQQFLRRISRALGWFTPRTPFIALLAPDGAGKSSLISQLEQQIAWPTRSVYLGLYQRTVPIGESSALHARSESQAGHASARSKKVRFPTLLIRTWRKYFQARQYQASHQIVLCDRYPTDALLPQQPRRTGLKRLRRWLLGHCCPLPDQTLILDAPGSVLFARKGEHSVAWLEQQRQNYLDLAKRLPRCITLDATRELSAVRRDVSRTIWRLLRQRHGEARS